MPNYADGKIYKLECSVTGKVYVGSTTQKLAPRKDQHIQGFKMWKRGHKKHMSSYEVVENGNFEIMLIEAFPCSSKKELEARERHHIESMTCINRYIPGRTQEEWNEANKDRIKQLNREYEKSAKRQEYLEVNKDKRR
eukprot:13554-Eustigmatos_ZCMA.PRE.1